MPRGQGAFEGTQEPPPQTNKQANRSGLLPLSLSFQQSRVNRARRPGQGPVMGSVSPVDLWVSEGVCLDDGGQAAKGAWTSVPCVPHRRFQRLWVPHRPRQDVLCVPPLGAPTPAPSGSDPCTLIHPGAASPKVMQQAGKRVKLLKYIYF